MRCPSHEGYTYVKQEKCGRAAANNGQGIAAGDEEAKAQDDDSDLEEEQPLGQDGRRRAVEILKVVGHVQRDLVAVDVLIR